MLKEAVLGLARVAMLWNATNPGAARTWQETEAAANTLGLEVYSAAVRNPEEFDQAIAGAAMVLRPPVPSALLIAQDPLTLTYRDRIVGLVAKTGLPAMYGFREFVEAGGLMSYAADLTDNYRTLATFVVRPGHEPQSTGQQCNRSVHLSAGAGGKATGTPT